MLSATSRQPCVDFSTLDGITTAVKQNVADLAGSGHYYVTPEICRELKHIDSGINHIRLDHDILKTERWNRICDPATTFVHRQGTVNTLHGVTEQLLDIKDRMYADRINCLVDNKAREAHHLTIQDLKSIESEARPYVHDSMVRLKQYCDNVGVTDRYTGYRNNLNRGNRNPVNLAFSWYDPVNKQRNTTIKLRPESDSKFSHLECSKMFPNGRMTQSAPHTKVHNPCIKPLTVEEQCGINITFPGTTEYIDRYSTRTRDRPSVDYPINPTADYRINGRPMAKQRYICSETEYQLRYEWPDGERIKMFPWQRK